jgi:hypothetical protein
MRTNLIGYEHGDYVLDLRADGVWVTVGNIAVKITRTTEGVIVDLYADSHEMSDSLATCGVMFSEADEVINPEV